MTEYTYSISQAFPQGKVDSARLLAEIRASTIVVAVDRIDTIGDNCTIWFKASLSQSEKESLDTIVATHSGEPLPDDTVQKVEAVAPVPILKPPSPKITLVSHNWCDRTTWYGDAARVVEEVAQDLGDHTVYQLANTCLIDAYHGKIFGEDLLKDADGNSYRVVVKVNDQVKVEQDPHLGTGGDFTVDYANGRITFLEPLSASDVVKATYHKCSGSTFYIRPHGDRDLRIDAVEVQFSEDIELRDSFKFQAYGYVKVFAPQLMEPPYNLPPEYKIPIGDPLIYKTFLDFLSDSNGAYPGYPAFGGSNWRALKKQAYIFVWDYVVGSTLLHGDYGMEIRVLMEHGVPCGGSYATATFYCTTV